MNKTKTDIDGSYKKAEESLLTTLSSDEAEIFKSAKQKSEADYNNLLGFIKELPPIFYEKIFRALDNYITSQSLLNSYENEYFYKAGFLTIVIWNKKINNKFLLYCFKLIYELNSSAETPRTFAKANNSKS